MSVLVKKFNVRTKGKKYKVGETIDTLTKAEEKRLIESGYCEAIASKKATGGQSDGTPPDDGEQDGPDTGINL
jgi:hypothetical protein